MQIENSDPRAPHLASRLFAAASRPLIAAALSGLCLFAVDRGRAMFTTTGRAAGRFVPAITLLAGHMLLPLVLTLLGAVAWGLARRVPESRPKATSVRIAVASAIVCSAFAWPAWWVGTQLTQGEWISKQSFAPLVTSVPVVALLVAAPVVIILAFLPVFATGSRARWTIGALAVVTAVVQLADHRIGIGLYPEFHLTMHVCAVTACLLGFRRLLDLFPGEPRWRRAAAVTALVLGAASPVVWFNMSGATRGALVLGSPIARDWLRQTRRTKDAHLLRDTLASLDVRAGTYDPGSASLPRGLIDGREYNVLLVVVDALRADALPPARPAEGVPFAQPGDTPNLDAWIDGAFRFSNAYSVATKTHLAMPGLFRSVEVSDNNVTMGVPLALRMEELGRTPVAVAVDYFFTPKTDSVGALVEGFGDMVFYEKKHTDTAVPSTIEMLESIKDQRFFLWLHMYNVHDPGFDGALLSSADCSRVDCYRRSMKWLDQEFAKLTAAMQEMGLDQNTIVVLVADHGEGLGDHGLMLHGPNVFEEDVRVPLAISIPGHPGHLIEEPVGTIDVAPTLVDLLGGPAEPQDRGRSLVPMMAGVEDIPPRPYYFQNHNGKVMGVVAGRDKVIFDSTLDVVYRFDLAKDPDEFDDVFDPEGDLDRELLRHLIGFNPAMVSDELEDPATQGLIAERMGEIDTARPGAAVPLLVRLIDREPAPELVTASVDLFERTEHRGLRLLILRYLYDAAPRRFGALIAKWLKKVANRPEELEIVEDLAAQGQASITSRDLLSRVNHYAKSGRPDQWTAYLRLIRPWTRTSTTYGPSLTTMLERIQAEPEVPLTVVELVLDSVATLETNEASATSLAAAVRPLLAHAEPRVRAMAARAIGGLDSQADTETIRQMLAAVGEDPRVRRESAAALAKLRGPDAIDDLIAAATDASMEVIVVRQLTAIGSERGLPYLRGIAENHYNSYLRREAARSITKIEAGPPKKRKGQSGKSKPPKKPRPARTTKGTQRARPDPTETG